MSNTSPAVGRATLPPPSEAVCLCGHVLGFHHYSLQHCCHPDCWRPTVLDSTSNCAGFVPREQRSDYPIDRIVIIILFLLTILILTDFFFFYFQGRSLERRISTIETRLPK